MTANLKFQLVSPEGVLYSGQVTMVVLPARRGEMGILPNHAPMVAALDSGVITIYKQGDEIEERIFVAGGFANINEAGCTVMADEGINVKDIHPDELETYVTEMYQAMEAEHDKEELENIQKNVVIARAKIDLFRKLKGK
jgi:F-type H+-transporting ATPase subunit epsilon